MNAFNIESKGLQQQRVISQTIDYKEDKKEANTNKNQLKGSEAIDWQDYTNKGETASKGLTNFGRSVPYSFNVDDVSQGSKVDPTKFTPADDGKSSPAFLALLS